SFVVAPPAPHPHLHSFPTRRSSDLQLPHRLQPRGQSARVRGAPRGQSAAGTRLRPAACRLSGRVDYHPGRKVHLLDCAAEHVRRSEEHTSELQSPYDLVCRLLLEKK